MMRMMNVTTALLMLAALAACSPNSSKQADWMNYAPYVQQAAK